VYNEGLYVTEQDREGKLMLLSKKAGNTKPDAMDTRPIVLLNLGMKVLQAIFLHMCESRIMKYIPNWQLGFRKSTSVELC
jgi:hypothetical protein